MFRMD